jgi:hypothetical protein
MLKKLYASLAGACLLLSFSLLPSLKAQMPSQQFGVGMHMTGSINGGAGGGLDLIYALSQSLQVNCGLGMLYQSQGNTNATSFRFSPGINLFFAGTNSIRPFVGASLAINKAGNSDTETSLFAGGGLAYFVTKNFGVYGAVPVLGIGISPGSTTINLGGAINLGATYFF